MENAENRQTFRRLWSSSRCEQRWLDDIEKDLHRSADDVHGDDVDDDHGDGVEDVHDMTMTLKVSNYKIIHQDVFPLYDNLYKL